MVAAVVIAVGVMLFASGPLSRFVHEHPTVKMLALSFLLLIGVTLVADGFGLHIDKAYIYAAMGFSVFVEALNLRAARSGRRRRPGRAASHVRQGRAAAADRPGVGPGHPGPVSLVERAQDRVGDLVGEHELRVRQRVRAEVAVVVGAARRDQPNAGATSSIAARVLRLERAVVDLEPAQTRLDQPLDQGRPDRGPLAKCARTGSPPAARMTSIASPARARCAGRSPASPSPATG